MLRIGLLSWFKIFCFFILGGLWKIAEVEHFGFEKAWMMLKSKQFALAIDIGASRIRLAVVAHGGRIVKKKEIYTPKSGRSGKVIPEAILKLIQEEFKAYLPDVDSIGISAIGPLDKKRDYIRNAPNISFKSVPLWVLKQSFKQRVEVLNDGSAGALGEFFYGAGAGGKIRNLVYITISTGIGGGVVLDGKLLSGRSGNAAEVGHFYVDSPVKMICGCGGISHWEAYASGKNMPYFFLEWARANRLCADNNLYATSKDILERAKGGDRIARQFVEVLNKINACAVSTTIAAYDPELIVFGGAVALNNYNLLIKGLKGELKGLLGKLPEIRLAKLKEDAPLLGALVKHGGQI